jgi:NAD(P)-dependent dehydrogenase (short-subunit alcohol dehydrogenase family)
MQTPSHQDLRGKVAWVTGGARGIGRAVCSALAERGLRIVLLDRDAVAGAETAAALGVQFVACDVSSADSWASAVERGLELFGAPDFVHLNAGVMSVPAGEPFLPLEALSLEQYRRIVSVNLDGVVFGLRALLPLMKSKGGAITVTASMVGLIPLPIDPMYSATKHALVGLVRSVAETLRQGPLRLNAICPGGVDTAIVPAALRASGMPMMSPDQLALDVVDLLAQGGCGEIRVRLSADTPAFAVPAPVLGGSAG